LICPTGQFAREGFLRATALPSSVIDLHPQSPDIGFIAAKTRSAVMIYGYMLDRYVRFLHGIIAHLSVPRVYLLGHSHGGFVAQRYALTRLRPG
jgi:pimeloyl-ACP methyl ester carboxylesterase